MKFTEFKKNYDEAVESIIGFQDHPQMGGLVRWMMETETNPYGYLPSHYAGSLSSAEAFAGLLHMIQYSLYDDGDITFVTVNGEPRIVFAWKHEDNFRDLVLYDQEKEFESDPLLKTTYKIKVLNIEPNEFGTVYDAYKIQFQEKWEHFKTMIDKVKGAK